jgi:hypothetical protein
MVSEPPLPRYNHRRSDLGFPQTESLISKSPAKKNHVSPPLIAEHNHKTPIFQLTSYDVDKATQLNLMHIKSNAPDVLPRAVIDSQLDTSMWDASFRV